MNQRRILRAWGGVILLVLGLAFFPQGVSDTLKRANGQQRGGVGAPMVGVLLGGVSLFFAGLVFWRVGRELWVVTKGVPARGTVTNADTDPGGRWLVTYTYRDRQGVAHENTITTEGQIWQRGDAADVRYVESRPAESMIVEPPPGAERALPVIDESLMDTIADREPTLATTVAAIKPHAGKIFKVSASLALATVVVTVVAALVLFVLLLGYSSRELVDQYGYWGTVGHMGIGQAALVVAVIAFIVVLPAFFVLLILGVLAGSLYSLVSYLLKK